MNNSEIQKYLEEKKQDINKICNDTTSFLMGKKFKVGNTTYTLNFALIDDNDLSLYAKEGFRFRRQEIEFTDE